MATKTWQILTRKDLFASRAGVLRGFLSSSEFLLVRKVRSHDTDNKRKLKFHYCTLEKEQSRSKISWNIAENF